MNTAKRQGKRERERESLYLSSVVAHTNHVAAAAAAAVDFQLFTAVNIALCCLNSKSGSTL